ncbi:hypothetical protein EJV47_14445 [Hymenobacter gummosus]|uniref:MoxR-vWA-beta-propeller ternary system domain-containing protein n=1 Tax=Hymenobacter gummosus TaxID=1776032 RepID=A0A3S0K4B4_9BACT|nr:hypothetical protein [Hymenobacter gummosus]RTQ48802.1 hypothetical protein EJV47_14445 [Hymenobacter gummosus]
MFLTQFLDELLSHGAVAVARRPDTFEPVDLEAATVLLTDYHADDALHLPHQAPAFEPAAALWAAEYLYFTVQLTLVRELDAAVVAERLPDYPGELTPAALYSADLLLRYLPNLLSLARGLAPDDVLVARLQRLAGRWPLSFVGHPGPAEEAAEAQVLAHPALRQEYVDRIIQAQDQARAARPALRPLVHAALGSHAARLWPDFHAFVLPA